MKHRFSVLCCIAFLSGPCGPAVAQKKAPADTTDDSSAPSKSTSKTDESKTNAPKPEAANFVGHKDIIPGQRLGFAQLGQSRAQFMAGLRADIIEAHKTNVNFTAPQFTTLHHAGGIEEIMADYKGRYGMGQKFQVLLKNDKVVQISTTEDRFSVAGGYKTDTEIPVLKAHFTDVQSTTYYFGKVRSNITTIVHDQVNEGFAYTEGRLRSPGSREDFRFVDIFTVHPKGQPYIPIWNGQSGSTTPTPLPKIVFPTPANMKPLKLTGAKLKAAQQALTAVRSLREMIIEGTNFKEYTLRLKKAEKEVKQGLASLPRSDFQREVSAALKAFKSAGEIWDSGLKNKSPYSDTGQKRQAFWRTAVKHSQNAEGLLK